MFSFLKLMKFSNDGKKYLVLNILTSLIGNIGLLLAPLFIGFAVDQMIGLNLVNHDGVLVNLVIAAICYVIGSLFIWISNQTSYLYALSITTNYRQIIFNNIHEADFKTTNNIQSGDMMLKTTTQMDMIYEATAYFFIHFIPGVVTLVFTLAMLIYLNYIFALAVIIMVPVMILYTKLSTKYITKYFKETQHLAGELSKIADEAFSNSTLIKSYNYEKTIKNKFKQEQLKYFKASEKSYFLSSINNPSFRFISNLSYLLLGVLFATLNFNNYIVTVGTFSSILVYGTMFYKPVNELSNYTSQFILASTAYQKIESSVNKFTKDIDGAILIDKKLDGNINFNHIDFSYSPEQELITDFSLNVKKGQKIGIVGKTGSGKSTIINLLMRFYKLNKGDIIVDEYNIENVSKNTLRSQYGLILQKPWMFNGSISDNIKYAKKDASINEVIAASKLAGSHDFISKLKDGYDTIYNPDGLLSVGQMQLITIARAIIMEPSIIILDEATSHIDSVMEKQISDAFKVLMHQKTTFMIAHRLTTIMDSDIIIVLKDGRIVEQGSHSELMKQNGAYKELYDAQFN